jgi:sec-independent protein translocase protein TatA
MFQRFGIWEILLILVIILIVFGVGKLPQVGNAIGKGIRAFKRGQSGDTSEEEEKEKDKIIAAKKKKPAAKKSTKS